MKPRAGNQCPVQVTVQLGPTRTQQDREKPDCVGGTFSRERPGLRQGWRTLLRRRADQNLAVTFALSESSWRRQRLEAQCLERPSEQTLLCWWFTSLHLNTQKEGLHNHTVIWATSYPMKRVYNFAKRRSHHSFVQILNMFYINVSLFL